MGRETLWTTELDTWHTVSIESYQFVLGEAKERLDEMIDDSRAITASGMKILLVYVTVLPGIAGYIFSDHRTINPDFITITVVSAVALFAIYIFTLLISLIAPGKIFFKGSQPKDICKEDVFKDRDSQTIYKNLLLNEIKRTQYKIERIQTNNQKRINRYK